MKSKTTWIHRVSGPFVPREATRIFAHPIPLELGWQPGSIRPLVGSMLDLRPDGWLIYTHHGPVVSSVKR